MSAKPPIQTSGPTVDASVPWEVRRHLQLIYQKLGNHTQAFQLQNSNTPSGKSGNTTTIISGGNQTTVAAQVGIPVNNQSGVTSYATQLGDDGALVVLSDASPIAVSLTTQQPPWGCWIVNQGSSTATLTPAIGTISYPGTPGAASMPVSSGNTVLVAFDGANWWATQSIAASGGVTQIIAGSNITISPAGGTGAVTINASGGGSSYLNGTVTVAASGTSGTFKGTGTVTGAGVGMAVAASAPALINLCHPSQVSWVADVVSSNTVEVQVTLPNIGGSWSNITFYVSVFV